MLQCIIPIIAKSPIFVDIAGFPYEIAEWLYWDTISRNAKIRAAGYGVPLGLSRVNCNRSPIKNARDCGRFLRSLTGGSARILNYFVPQGLIAALSWL